MNLLNTLAYLIVNTFHIYLFFLAYRIFFGESRVGRKLEFLAYFAFYAVNSAAFLAVGSPYLNLTTSIVPLLALTCLYPGKTSSKILHGLFIFVASMLLESVSLSFLQLLDAYFDGMEIACNMVANMCLFASELIYKQTGPRKKNEQQVEYWLAIIVLPVGSIVITMLVYGGGGYQAGLNMVIVTILIAMNILAFRLYDLLTEYYVSSYEQKMLQQNEAYTHEIELIRKADETARLLRHDMRNHVSALKQLVEQGDREEAVRYLDAFAEDVTGGSYADTGNPVFDSILNYKLSAAKDLGANLTFEIAVPEGLEIEPFDISVLLGNLLDNANEALANSPEKNMEIQIRMDRGLLYIHISNSYDGNTQKAVLNGREIYQTRKEDKQLHGFGLQSITKVVEKYHGVIETDDSNGRFTVDIMLYLSK